ncbi:tyrosine-protein phosphatase [Parabacteroides sp. PF5-9]|uniref:tyrosine-protein phosphatase n=1 Tax=Parabacteroides sp. PF5-9 TaxID=1742404 RepID=UPI0024760A7A|nr:tyrosine-protein phosphatase [Parabacteroides sp. PF5-9]MDH6356864.1 protein tyrosine/serine phosphatase [Parabacteroides sp. PF5-9]
MFRNIFFLISSAILSAGCSDDKPNILALCERDDIGNYIIKWETEPVMTGSMKIYVSDSPDVFPNTNPVVYARIEDGIARYVTQDNFTRKYFQLSLNEKYHQVVGSRFIEMERVQNLRDLGGYADKRQKNIRWGKIYRSGDLTTLTQWDEMRLTQLGIKTIIDLRDDDEVALYGPTKYTEANVIRIPIVGNNLEQIIPRIYEERMRKRDALIYMQDLYLRYIHTNITAFRQIFELFEDQSNYPILFSCQLGKDQSGIVAALLLAALGVTEESIIRDYVASNDYIDVSLLPYSIQDMSTETQETVTILLSSTESLMNFTIQSINREYGSLDHYLTEELQLTDKKREALKEILLN